MGKFYLYRSRRNISKKVRGYSKKYVMPLKTKDIDTTLSYCHMSHLVIVLNPKRVKYQIHFNIMCMKHPTGISWQTLVQIQMEQMEIMMFQTMLTYVEVNMQEGVLNDSKVLNSSLPSYLFCIKLVAYMTSCY